MYMHNVYIEVGVSTRAVCDTQKDFLYAKYTKLKYKYRLRF